MITLTINVGEAEYTEVQLRCRYSTRTQRARQRVRVGFISLISIFGAFLLAKDQPVGIAFPAAVLAPALMLFGIVVACFKKPSLHKEYLKAAITLNGVDVEIDGESYRWNSPGKTTGVLYWSSFTSWMETDRTITLVRGGLLYILQKSALDEGGCSELRRLCAEKLGAEAANKASS